MLIRLLVFVMIFFNACYRASKYSSASLVEVTRLLLGDAQGHKGLPLNVLNGFRALDLDLAMGVCLTIWTHNLLWTNYQTDGLRRSCL